MYVHDDTLRLVVHFVVLGFLYVYISYSLVYVYYYDTLAVHVAALGFLLFTYQVRDNCFD